MADYYDVKPKIIPAGSGQEVRITPLFDHAVLDGDLEFVYTPIENRGPYDGFGERHRPDWRREGPSLVVSQVFEGEQEHSVALRRPGGDLVRDFRFFSLEEDLFRLRPYKGDMHIHSNRSDGRESPGYVAASCRKIGFDFMALTDHGKYEPSLESQQAFEGIETDLRIYPGEEVHPPNNPVHIINFGAGRSINAMFQEPRYDQEVRHIEGTLQHIADERDRYCMASSMWCFDRIREFGGLGIFCHPYWFTREHYHIPGSLTDLMFDMRPFDAYELIGGYHPFEVESNYLQVLRYQEECIKGNTVPIVGVSDAHGCDTGALFGWYYTIVFARSLDFADITDAIKEGLAVAVEHLPGTTPRAHGPFRLAKYAQFLMREVFPSHDRICRLEGESMIDYLASGDPASYTPPGGKAFERLAVNFGI